MLIKDMFSQTKPVISFEIFPPKKDYPVETIYQTLQDLRDLRPDFISVTYGAGGSSGGKTLEIASLIKNKYKIEALVHLTCVNSTPQEIDYILQELDKENIKNILALRGDLPPGCEENTSEFKYAKDLIKYIKGQPYNFSVSGACYPEGHQETKNLELDIKYLKEKVDCGLDFLITQLFFDNNYLYNFLDKAQKQGINIPILAGIMPVLDKKQVERMVSLCGATISEKFIRIMDKYQHSPDALREAGIAYATEQIIDLLAWGIDGVHIYTMNRPQVTRKIVENIIEIRNIITKEQPHTLGG